MSTTAYPVGHPLAQQLWAKKLLVETLRNTFVFNFLGKTADSIVQYRTEIEKDAGDRVTIGLRGQLLGAGIAGDGTLEGNEEALATFTDTLVVDQLRHAVRSAGKMSEERVPFSVREEAMSGLKDWWSDRIDTSFFNQIAGNTAQGDVRYTGMQAAVAPDANHIFRPNSRTTDESLTTGDEMSLTLIDRMIARATQFTTAAGTGVSPLRPISYRGGKYFVMFLHDNQVFQLRSNTNSGQWADITKARVTGGEMDENPLFTGGDYVGLYNGVVLHKAPRVPNGVNSTTAAAVANARRAILCGAQSAFFAMGQGYGDPQKARWVEEAFDYGNQLGVSAAMIWGIKKARYNSTDFGTYVCSTFSPAP
jgi:N4-gp56 family major capsid protein